MANPRLIPVLADLGKSSVEELRALWHGYFKSQAPAGAHRDYLNRALAYRIQEEAHGRLSAKLRRRLLAGNKPARVTNTRQFIPAVTLKPGTRVLREWRGEMHEAVVLEKGFMYRGKIFKSLSVIAREITGTRWSGPSFFGLRSSSTATGTQANKVVMDAAHGV